ncbi:MAG: DUF4476 domain-containing protein [Deltaproteobacteria bacterium]|nr:DUF4476 domain-containing protein [Deltaproteobacteria bacterium]
MMLSLVLLAALTVNPTSGNLVVNADEPFALFVDGKQVNVANLRESWTVNDLAAGRHQIKVDSWPSPFKSEKLAEGVIDVPGGSEVRIRAEKNKLIVIEIINLLEPPPGPPAPGAVTATASAGGNTLSVSVSTGGQPMPPPGGHGGHGHGGREHHDRREPMFVGDFNALKEAIKAESFENKKTDVLSTAASSNYFSVDQVGDLIDLFQFSPGKLKALELCKARIVDSKNAFQVYSHFTFEADKKKAKQILGQ